ERNSTCIKNRVSMEDAAKRKNMVLTLPALGDGAKNTIGRFIPNIIVENHLEYDPNIIRR
ncbi:MAG: hypothetical protein WBZ20_16045, partial [Nitrososphaeraceae archaeon]